LHILFNYGIIVGGCYYDIIVVIYLLNFCAGSSMCPVTEWISQGCDAVVKMTQLRLRLRICWFSWVWLWFRNSLFSWLRLLVVFRH